MKYPEKGKCLETKITLVIAGVRVRVGIDYKQAPRDPLGIREMFDN